MTIGDALSVAIAVGLLVAFNLLVAKERQYYVRVLGIAAPAWRWNFARIECANLKKANNLEQVIRGHIWSARLLNNLCKYGHGERGFADSNLKLSTSGNSIILSPHKLYFVRLLLTTIFFSFPGVIGLACSLVSNVAIILYDFDGSTWFVRHLLTLEDGPEVLPHRHFDEL